MEIFLKIILPILSGVIFLLFWITQGLNDKRKMSACTNLFVPLINAPFKAKSEGAGTMRIYCYEAIGNFQGRKVFIVTPGFRFFRKKFSLSQVSVEIHNYSAKLFQKGIGGIPVEYEGKKYAVDNWLDGTTRLKSMAIKEISESTNILESTKEHLQLLCNLADKIDNGEVKHKSLVRKS